MKMNRVIILFSICFLGALGSFAQKVKYKELVLLLNAKQYEQAEPFLKKYLKDHDDNPNAYLFMGFIFQEKAVKSDVLKETESILLYADSAIANFQIAGKTIDERELRRNSEYYEAYNRRNARTGEFGINISDVKLDLEKRTQSLKDRKTNVRKLKDSYLNAQLLYAKSVQRFNEMKANRTENKYYLTADANTVLTLRSFIALYDSMMASFENYKTFSKLVGKTGYNQTLNLIPVKSFSEETVAEADFTKDEVKLWDFKGWAMRAIDIIEGEVAGLKAELIKADQELNQLGEKLKKDSVSVKGRLESAVSKFLMAKAKKYDSDPLPLAIFTMKISEFEYGSELIQHKKLKDSMDLNLKLALVKSELAAAKRLDSISTAVNARDIDAESITYFDFITNSYGNASVVKSLSSALKEFAQHQIQLKQKELEIRNRALEWIIQGSDSIPLVANTTTSRKLHKVLFVKPDKFTVGLKYGADSLATGYFYTITPSRIPDVAVNFPIEKAKFKRISLPVSKAVAIDDGKGQIYFALVYSEEKEKDKYPASLAKIYRSDGLAWSFNYLLEALPSELHFAQDTGELSIKLVTTAGETKIMAIDKNGKIVK